MFAIVMLTALSMGGASRAAAGSGSEYTEQRETAPQASESWERRDIQETETKTVRNQHPASTAHAQRDWTGCNPASRHTHRHVHHLSDLAGMYPDPPPRDARGVKTKQETKTRQHCSNARWDTDNTEKTRAHREDYGETTGYGRKYRRRRLGQWGEVDEDDEYNGDEYVAKEGPADGKRLVWSHRWVSIPLVTKHSIICIYHFTTKLKNKENAALGIIP